MTRADFLKEYGPEFRKLANKPMFDALLQTIDGESPAKALPGKSENDRLHGAAVFTNEIAGWEKLRAFIAELPSAPDEPFEPEDKFSKEEQI